MLGLPVQMDMSDAAQVMGANPGPCTLFSAIRTLKFTITGRSIGQMIRRDWAVKSGALLGAKSVLLSHIPLAVFLVRALEHMGPSERKAGFGWFSSLTT